VDQSLDIHVLSVAPLGVIVCKSPEFVSRSRDAVKLGKIVKRHTREIKDLVEWSEPLDPLSVRLVHLDHLCLGT
jgi:hypothetical protein